MESKGFTPQHKIFAVLSLSSLIGTAILGSVAFLNFQEEHPQKTAIVPTAPQKEVIYPAPYSDSHITINAIVTDPKFNNLVSFNSDDLLANVESSIQINKARTKETSATSSENGTWLWTPLLEITPTYQTEILTGAKKGGIKNIYLSIDSYLDIYVMDPGVEKEKRLKAFDAALESFIREAHKNGISVDAEAGWRNWAERGNSYKAFAVLEYAINFNKNHEEKLRGFQYDVEPYLLPLYKIDKKETLRNFITLVNETLTRLNGSDLEFSVVIPEFYDGASNETPTFSYRGKTGYTINHLLTVLERRPGSKIIVMSYRNFATGEDGTIDVSRDEILSATNYQTKVIIAQETGNVPPPYITFYDTSRSYYEKQIQIIEQTFAEDNSFGGIATHYINAFLELK